MEGICVEPTSLDHYFQFVERPAPFYDDYGFTDAYLVAASSAEQIAFLIHYAEQPSEFYLQLSTAHYAYSAAENFDMLDKVSQWLIGVNRVPVRILDHSAPTWHEGVVGLHIVMMRRALLAGYPDLAMYFNVTALKNGNIPDIPDEFDLDSASKVIHEYRDYDYREVLAQIKIESVHAYSDWRAAGSPKSEKELNLNDLNETQRRVFEYVRANPGKIGKEVASAVDIAEGTLSRHVFPKLRKYGLRNQPGGGYSITDHVGAEPR